MELGTFLLICSSNRAPQVLALVSSLIQRQRALAKNRMLLEQMDRMFQGVATPVSSPRYELVDDDEKFQLSVDVPGVKQEDIDVSTADGFLTVRGQRMASSKNSRFASKFSKMFSLDPAVEVDHQFSASLNNGVLAVMAPKDMKKLEANVRKIPILESKNEVSPAQENKPSEELKDEIPLVTEGKKVMETEEGKTKEADKKVEEKLTVLDYYTRTY
jgi:HSP20 family protein